MIDMIKQSIIPVAKTNGLSLSALNDAVKIIQVCFTQNAAPIYDQSHWPVNSMQPNYHCVAEWFGIIVAQSVTAETLQQLQ